jgi:hypothetical protein
MLFTTGYSSYHLLIALILFGMQISVANREATSILHNVIEEAYACSLGRSSVVQVAARNISLHSEYSEFVDMSFALKDKKAKCLLTT